VGAGASYGNVTCTLNCRCCFASREALRDAFWALGEIAGNPVAVLVLAGSSARFFGGYAIGAFLGKYLTNVFPGRAGEYSIANAVVIGLGGAAAAVAGGWTADYVAGMVTQAKSNNDELTVLHGQDKDKDQISIGTRQPGLKPGGGSRGATMALVPALTGLLAVPCMAAVLYAPTLEWSMVALLVEYLLAEGWFGPIMGVLLGVLPGKMHGSAVGLFVLCTTAVGSVAPLLLGMAWDAAAGGVHGSMQEKAIAIRGPLLASVAASYACGSMFFTAAAWLMAARAIQI